MIHAGAVGSGVIKTANGGRTWQVANAGLAGGQVLSMVIDRVHHAERRRHFPQPR